MFGRCTITKRNSRSRKRWDFLQFLAKTNSGYRIDISTMNSLRESMQHFPTSRNAIISALEEGVEFVLVTPRSNSWADFRSARGREECLHQYRSHSLGLRYQLRSRRRRKYHTRRLHLGWSFAWSYDDSQTIQMLYFPIQGIRDSANTQRSPYEARSMQRF
jgi:hypothetical protein